MARKPAAWVGGRHRRRSHARRARASGRRDRHHPAVLARPGVRSRRRRLRSTDEKRRADPALRTAAAVRHQDLATGTASRQPNRACRRSTKEGASNPIRPSKTRWRRRSSASVDLQATTLGGLSTLRFAAAATSVPRSETSSPTRSATRCRARTSPLSTTRRAVSGQTCRGSADVRTALRCVSVRQSHRASDAERRELRGWVADEIRQGRRSGLGSFRRGGTDRVVSQTELTSISFAKMDERFTTTIGCSS